MIVFGLVRAHTAQSIAVATRTDRSAEHDRRLRAFVFAAQFREYVDGILVHFGQSMVIVAELDAPVRAGTPGGRVEYKAGAMLLGDCEVACVVVQQPSPPIGGRKQHEGCEMRKRDALVKDQRRLHAAVAQEQPTLQEWQAPSVFGHVGLHRFSLADEARGHLQSRRTR